MGIKPKKQKQNKATKMNSLVEKILDTNRQDTNKGISGRIEIEKIKYIEDLYQQMNKEIDQFTENGIIEISFPNKNQRALWQQNNEFIRLK